MTPNTSPLSGLAASTLLAFVFCAQPGIAQELQALQASQAMGPLRVPIHTAPDDPVGGAYGVWAVGRDYKAGFAGDATFVPYLGKDYPRTRQLGWHTLAVRCGNRDVVAENETPRRWHGDWRYEYRFAAMTEAYDVRADGLEQTFVFPQRPAGDGDLVVRGRFATDLTPAAQADGSLVFADAEGRALIRYGMATAIDADGRQLPLVTLCQGNVATLTVPASWLAGASFPLTVDPLLTAIGMQVDASPHEYMELIRDDGTNTLLVSSARSVSASDYDAFGAVYQDAFGGTTYQPVFADVTASWSTPQTACSYCGPRNKWVIAITRQFSTTAAIRVWAEPTSTAALVTAVLPVATVAGLDWRPAVGGIAKSDELNFPYTGNHAVVVFQRDVGATPWNNTTVSDVMGVLVDCSTSPATLGAPFQVGLTTAGYDQEWPSVTKLSEGGVLPSWVVAFQIYNNNTPGDDWDLMAVRVDAAGTSTAHTLGQRWTSLANPANTHAMFPKIAGRSGRYCIFSQGNEEAAPMTRLVAAGQMLVSERFDWPVGGTIVRSQPSIYADAGAGNAAYVVQDVAYDSDTDSAWAAIVRASAPMTPGMRFYRFGGNGQWCTTHGLLAVNGQSIPSTYSAALDYNDDANNFVLTFSHYYSTAPYALVGAEFVYPTPAAVSLGGFSCSSVALAWQATDAFGTLIAANSQVIGNQFTRIAASGAAATTLHFPVLSLATTSLPVPHPLVPVGCNQLVSTTGGYLGMLPIGVGANPTWAMPLPEFLSPFTLYCQDWMLEANGTFTSSRRLNVPLVK
jgi:hypothetical protein